MQYVLHIAYLQILYIVLCCQPSPIYVHSMTVLCPYLTAPGPVSELRYEEITNTSVNIIWKPPKEPNGVIRAYSVEHGVYGTDLAVNVTINATGPTHTIIQALSKFLVLHILPAIFSKWACYKLTTVLLPLPGSLTSPVCNEYYVHELNNAVETYNYIKRLIVIFTDDQILINQGRMFQPESLFN